MLKKHNRNAATKLSGTKDSHGSHQTRYRGHSTISSNGYTTHSYSSQGYNNRHDKRGYGGGGHCTLWRVDTITIHMMDVVVVIVVIATVVN